LVNGSVPCVRAPLWPLQGRHESHKFSSTDCPPIAIGIRCSYSIAIPISTSLVRQYPQRCRACWLIRRCKEMGILCCDRLMRPVNEVFRVPPQSGFVAIMKVTSIYPKACGCMTAFTWFASTALQTLRPMASGCGTLMIVPADADITCCWRAKSGRIGAFALIRGHV